MTELFFSQHPIAWIIGFTLFGLIIGSFLNVVIFRLPLMLEKQWQEECKWLLGHQTDLTELKCPHCYYALKFRNTLSENEIIQSQPINLATPRSLCPHCGTTLTWKENIPLLSFLWQKGRCRNCHRPISWQYPIVELVSTLVACFLAYYFGFQLKTILLFAFYSITMVLTWIDIRKGLLPDNLTYLLLWLGLLSSLFSIFISPAQAIIGATVGYLSLWSIFWLFKLITHKDSMGHGDFKLAAAIGAWTGWQLLIIVILFAALFGLVAGLIQIYRGKAQRDTPFAFGPYLAVTGFGVLVCGEWVLGVVF